VKDDENFVAADEMAGIMYKAGMPKQAPRSRRFRRGVLLAYGIVATAFAASSTWQITCGAFSPSPRVSSAALSASAASGALLR
jgi:hypothetical protein